MGLIWTPNLTSMFAFLKRGSSEQSIRLHSHALRWKKPSLLSQCPLAWSFATNRGLKTEGNLRNFHTADACGVGMAIDEIAREPNVTLPGAAFRSTKFLLWSTDEIGKGSSDLASLPPLETEWNRRSGRARAAREKPARSTSLGEIKLSLVRDQRHLHLGSFLFPLRLFFLFEFLLLALNRDLALKLKQFRIDCPISSSSIRCILPRPRRVVTSWHRASPLPDCVSTSASWEGQKWTSVNALRLSGHRRGRFRPHSLHSIHDLTP
jgi:hypothetical protein